jgi:hypothetical protein
MKQKKYIHIKEYNITKMLIDYLELDVDDDDKLCYGPNPLEFKSKFFTLVPYKDMKDFSSEDLVPFRPLTNINHCQYLINLFSEINDCESLFEHKAMKDDDKLLEGEMKLTYKKDIKKLKVYGMKNLNILMGAMISKMILADSFKDLVSDFKKLDGKVSDSKKPRK